MLKPSQQQSITSVYHRVRYQQVVNGYRILFSKPRGGEEVEAYNFRILSDIWESEKTKLQVEGLEARLRRPYVTNGGERP